ncbi:resolvase [Oceanobacillus picturae]|uniref:Resolvase n=1 Tax=Oceanobacillus picturae TaxID=171693 RepID=A0A0U9H818_9BACI|nr:hypothetical protein [Oceanobacillus picturae]GAQ18523.1 resolvase [Oceanobacillus picturae]
MDQQQWYQERDQHLELMEVFVKHDTSAYGGRFAGGSIYNVEKYKADELIKNGDAIKVDVPELDKIKSKAGLIISKLEGDIKGVNDNHRLTVDAKQEDIDKLVSEAESELNDLNENYYNKTEELITNQKRSISSDLTGTTVDHLAVEQEVGILKSEIEMSPTFEEALNKISEKVTLMDTATARKFLSQFIEVKQILQEKRTGKPIEIVQLNRVYQEIKDASYTSKQAKINEKIEILESILNKKGLSNIIPPKFRIIKRRHMK